MNINRYIAKKLLPKKGRQFSKPICRIATASVALGICVMVWAFAITTGFRKEIREKIVGFGSHIVIQRFENNQSYEKQPFSMREAQPDAVTRLPNVRRLQGCASKAGIIQTGNEIEGIVFKGIGSDYDPSFFSAHLVRGRIPDYAQKEDANSILISSILADKLNLDTGQKIRVCFVQEPVRQRIFRIEGIYNTGMESYDKNYALCSIGQIRKLNNWPGDSVDAIEVLLDDFDEMETTCGQINRILPYNIVAETAKEQHRDMFDWISLFDQNVLVLVILITLVVCITLISTQLTITLEQIPTIGTLQTIGCSTKDIRNIFLHISWNIIVKGMIIGNTVALLVCLLQQQTHLFRLDPKNYFMDYVPMLCQWQHLVGINILVSVISICFLLFPAHYVTRHVRIVDALEIK